MIFLNIAYYIVTNWQNFFPANSSVNQAVSLKSYSDSKLGFEVQYPSAWVVQDSGDMVTINPLSPGGIIYFSVALRSDFKSLNDIKKTLATNIPLTPVQISKASGFEYSDSDSDESIWLSYENKIYLIRTYSSIALGDDEAEKILSYFQFTN